MRVNTYRQFLVTEASARELVDGSNRSGRPFLPKRAEYVGLSFRKKALRFRVGKYRQEVRIPDLRAISRMPGSDAEKVSTALSGDVQVHCTCPDYKYVFQYMGAQLGYGLRPEEREPVVRNPRLEGTVCKHLDYLLGKLLAGDYLDDIAADFERSRSTKWYSDVNRDVD